MVHVQNPYLPRLILLRGVGWEMRSAGFVILKKLLIIYSLAVRARYAWGLARCAFGISMNLDLVSELCTWVLNFRVRLRGLIVVG